MSAVIISSNNELQYCKNDFFAEYNTSCHNNYIVVVNLVKSNFLSFNTSDVTVSIKSKNNDS